MKTSQAVFKCICWDSQFLRYFSVYNSNQKDKYEKELSFDLRVCYGELISDFVQ